MKIKEQIYSVGVVDKDVRIFHGYATPIGTTYNSYLIIDDKITLVDLVKAQFSDEFIKNIENIVPLEKIDNIICNHVEPDHSGAFSKLIPLCTNATVYGTLACEKELHAYYPETEFNFQLVKLGDSLTTGKYNFDFFPMPMVHWPDSMSTYLREAELLFSNDAFGQHIGTGQLLEEELELSLLLEQAADYYANIVMPFGKQVERLITQLANLPIQLICPSHGLIWNKSCKKIIELYGEWARGELNQEKVVIVYDTMWHTTEKMAKLISDEYRALGMEVISISLQEKHYSYAMTQLLNAKYIFVGSPTLNNQMLPSVAAFLCYMRGLRPQNRIGMAFGSYGWSGESIPLVQEQLKAAGMELLEARKVLWNI